MADETRRVIFELEVNNSKLGVELATINDRLATAKQLQKDWNKELSGLKEGTKEYSNVAKLAADANATVRKLNDEAKKTTEALKLSEAVPGSYNALKSEIKLTREALDKLVIGSDAYNKTEGELNTLLTKEIEIRTAQKSLFQERIKGAINESDVTKTLTQQYKELQIQLQGLEVGSAEFNKTAKEAGALKDKINDAKQAAKSFSTGSNLEQFGNVLGNIKGDITSLDFAGAAEKAKTLSEISKSMTFASAVESAKALGATLLETGKALLTNPLFIMAAAITGIVLALKMWSDEEKANKAIVTQANKDKLESLRAYGDFEERLAKARGVSAEEQTAQHLINLAQQKQLAAAELDRLNDREDLNEEEEKQRKELSKRIVEIKQDELLTIAQFETDEKNKAEEDQKKKDDDEKKKAEDRKKALEQRAKEEQAQAIDQSNKLRELDRKAFEAKLKAQEEERKEEERIKADLAKIKQQADAEELAQLDEDSNKRFDIVATNFKKQEEAKRKLVEAEVQLEQTKLAALGQLSSLAAGLAKGNADAQKAFFAFEKIVAVLQIVKNLQVEKAGIAAANSLLGIAGAPLTLAQNQAANIRAATGIATIIAQAIPQFYEGGFTERGNPREATRNLGPRPYIYHKNEYIVPDKVLSTPEGARHVMRLETLRKGSANRYSSLPGYADGGLTERTLTDSVNAEIQARESMAEVVAQQKIFVAVEDINTGQRSVQVTESRNTI